MYCPRCGAPDAETTKFCRQCGLAVNQVSNYVASGGTAPLGSAPLSKVLSGFTPQQRLVFTILFFVFLPGFLGMLGSLIGLGELAGVGGVLMPFGILWAVFRYKNEMRQLQMQAMQQPMQQPMWPPQQTPMQMPPPAMQQQPYQPPVSPPPTNPLARPSGASVTEDETQRLPGQNQ